MEPNRMLEDSEDEYDLNDQDNTDDGDDGISNNKNSEKNKKRRAPPGKEKQKTKSKKIEIEVIERDEYEKYLEQDPPLSEILKMTIDLAGTTSINEKQARLSKHVRCIKALLYTNQPYWQYHITSKNVQKKKADPAIEKLAKPAKNIFHLLDMLKDGEISGNAALATAALFVKNNKKFESLIYGLIDKDLKIRCSEKTINKVFPDLIPVFSVALAHDFDEKTSKNVDFEDDTWLSSRKLDGVRVITIIDEEGNIKFLSREGNEFTTLAVVEGVVKTLNLKNIVLDGEMCIMKDDGTEDFKKVVGDIKKKNFVIMSPCYMIFDMLTFGEFYSADSDRIYSERLEVLKKTILKSKQPVLTIVHQTRVGSEDQISAMMRVVKQKNWEGIMIRKDVRYEGKRSNNLLKIKKFFDEEFKVVGTDVGEMRFVIDHQEQTLNVLRNVTILLDGQFSVNVGSGFSRQERIEYAKNPKLIKGKTVSIGFFERTCDKNGKPSLRFPTFRGIYGQKRDI